MTNRRPFVNDPTEGMAMQAYIVNNSTGGMTMQ
jgi:hypothetical protein